MIYQDEARQSIIGFLQTEFTDERLAALLAHAEDGKLAFWSCCCFAGVPTAMHALRGEDHGYETNGGFAEHWAHPNWNLERRCKMSNAFAMLAFTDEDRRAELVPLIRAEMARREAASLNLNVRVRKIGNPSLPSEEVAASAIS